MNEIETQNHACLQSWYHNVWGDCNPALVSEHTAEYYLRHDVTGRANKLTGQQYADMCAGGMQGRQTADFQFFFVTEGDYVAALGRLIFTDGRKWDWVQLFRLEQGKLAETWLPGMGASDPLAYPKPENSWDDDAIPDQDHGKLNANKALIKTWFEDLATGNDVTRHLMPSVRWHDMQDADITLNAKDLQARQRSLMQGDKAAGLKLHIIAERDFVVATGLWTLGDDNRRWNWVQAFRVENGLIARSWTNAIGGTDPSITYDPQASWSADILPKNCTRIGVRV